MPTLGSLSLPIQNRSIINATVKNLKLIDSDDVFLEDPAEA